MKILLFFLCSFSLWAETFPLRPGGFKFIEKKVSSEIKKFSCDGVDLPFEKKDESFKSYLVVSYFVKTKKITCSFEYANGKKEDVYQIDVVDYPFKKEKLKVAPKNVNLSKKDLARYEREKILLKKVYASSAKEFLFSDSFLLPQNLSVSSEYGTKRVFNNVRASEHLGIDFRAPEGTPVYAANSGRILFSGDLFFSGNTVLIDHGLNLFTMYAHLSKLDLIEGDLVKKGDKIGLSGKTGRVSGPHLHFGVKASGNWVDGFLLK